MTVPTEKDRLEALRRLLAGVASGTDANDLASQITDLHPANNTFPGEVFMELAAEALAFAGVDRHHRINHEDLLSTHLSEVFFKGKQNRRIQYALFTTFAAHGGLEPDLLEEVRFWIEEYWLYTLFAAVTVIRACAEQSGISPEALAAELAAIHNIDIS
jgi:hypothetical protein